MALSPPPSAQPVLLTLTKPGYPLVGKHIAGKTRTGENPEEMSYVQFKVDNLDSWHFRDKQPLSNLLPPSLRSTK